ncbi:MAG: bacillithiol biosynthesis BshC [Planctomycetota bacterium]|nr:bacillithiol biosynthesis BshC [Planctomycetota bacterium]
MKHHDHHPLLEILRGPDRSTRSALGMVSIDPDELIQRARCCEPDVTRRQQLLEELRPRWAGLELPPAAREAVSRLEDPTTRIVIAGHQPALWGGPLLVISKILSLLHLASRMEAAGIPTVPIFWVADDDHDGSELDPGSFLHGKPLEMPFARGRRPIFDLRHPQLPEERLAALSDVIGSAPHARAALRIASGSICASPADEFISFISQVLPDAPLLPVLPRWLRGLQTPVIEQVLDDVDLYRDLVQRSIDEQIGSGVPAPVPAPRGMPLFVIDSDGLRRRPEEQGLSIEDVRGLDPDRISPDALLRTMVQDQLIDPVAVVMGPTELCYAIETRAVRQHRGWSSPMWLPRPRLRPIGIELIEQLVEEGVARDQIHPGAEASDLIQCEEATREAIQIAGLGQDLIQKVEALVSHPDATMALRRRARRLVKTWRHQFQRLEISVEGQLVGPTVEARRKRVTSLLELLFPDGREPERCRNILDLIGHHGIDVIERMRRSMEEEESPWDGAILEFPGDPVTNKENLDVQC